MEPSRESIRLDYVYLNKHPYLLSRGLAPSFTSEVTGGYLKVSHISRNTLYLHRAVWIYHKGCIPSGYEVDHIDRDVLDNSIENLRLATRAQNNQNCKVRKDNSSGVKGVHYHKPTGKWVARISVDNKRLSLGSFTSIVDAENKINYIRKKIHKEFACNGHQSKGIRKKTYSY